MDGGANYTEYLQQISINLPADIDVTVMNIPTQTQIDAGQVACILNRPVEDIELSMVPYLSSKNFNFLITNEGSLARFIDASITAVFIGHGSSAMPANSEFMHANVLSYFDILLGSSRAGAQMVANGLSLYRSKRRQLAIGIDGPGIRSDLRQTCLMPTRPMKSAKRHNEPQANVPKRNMTIGLLPTAIGSIQFEVSIYHNLIAIIQMLIEKFPASRIVFRPYPLDLQNPQIRKLCEDLKSTGQVGIDLPDSPSSVFYDKCDIIITDASTGGVSSMLRKTVPPIYFVPAAALQNTVTRWFVENIRNHVPMAHSVAELEECIRHLANAKPQELFKYYVDFCDNELFLEKSQADYFADMLHGNIHAKDTILVDAFGETEGGFRSAAE